MQSLSCLVEGTSAKKAARWQTPLCQVPSPQNCSTGCGQPCASTYSPRTEQVYVDWIKRFIRFHGVRHPQEMGPDEVKAFLSHLATQMNVAASTQNQAFSALLFLYQEVIKERLPWIDDIVRAKRPAKLPVGLLRPKHGRFCPICTTYRG